jgi:hypothetical protein
MNFTFYNKIILIGAFLRKIRNSIDKLFFILINRNNIRNVNSIRYNRFIM